MINNKKILFISTEDNFISRFLLPHIQYLQNQGNLIECACKQTGFWFDELSSQHNLTVYNIPFGRNPLKPSNLKAYKMLKNLQNKNHYDLIYCQTPVGGVMGRLLAKKYHIPCIYVAHGFHFYKGCPLKNKLIFKTIEKWCSKYTDALVTINEEDYQSALNFKAKKVYKINGIGVDLSLYHNEEFDKISFRKELGLSEDDFVVLSVGELNKNKNTLRLLDVMKNIDNPKIKYVICGDGVLKDKYLSTIQKYNLQDKVKFLGYRKDIPKILNISNVYIMPSYREGLSKAMMEAMCYGLPIIASNIRGNTDLLGNAEGGILCNPEQSEDFKQAIIDLASNAQLCEQFSARNKEFIKQYDINIVLKQLEKIYEEV